MLSILTTPNTTRNIDWVLIQIVALCLVVLGGISLSFFTKIIILSFIAKIYNTLFNWYAVSLVCDNTGKLVFLMLQNYHYSDVHVQLFIVESCQCILFHQRLFGAKTLSKPMLDYCQLTFGKNFSEIVIKIYNFTFTKMHLKISSEKWRSFCQGWVGVGGLNHVSVFLSNSDDCRCSYHMFHF